MSKSQWKDQTQVKIAKPIPVDFSKKSLDPSEVTPVQYELKTIGRLTQERDLEYHREWLTKHDKADVTVVNQDGQPIYAVYKSPLADHVEMTDALFKILRSQRLNEDEYGHD